MQLLTIPYAGAGAGFYRPWQQVATTMDIVPLQLPGREDRFAEAPLTEVSEAVEMLRRTVVETLASDAEVAVFGHSLGALLAYELTRRLVEESAMRVVKLIVSGAPAPWLEKAESTAGLGDSAFLAKVRETTGYDHPALRDQRLRDLLLPTLRADVAMRENYEYGTNREPLACPLTVIRGRDDQLVGLAEARSWARATNGVFKYVEVAGGHMYLCNQPPGAVVQMLETELRGAEDLPGPENPGQWV